MDIARLRELRAIGVREFEEDEHGFRVVFDERQPEQPKPPHKAPPSHATSHAMAALKGFAINPDQHDGSGRAAG